MAFGGGGGVVAEVGEEIACPICFEEFEEPKCLPSCAHNVCCQCLKGMTQANSKKIECPVCRKESKIPSDGVAGFPKNHLLARLIEGIPGRKERKVILQALKDCKEKMEVLQSCLTEMDNRFEATRDRADKMREEVKTAADLVVDLAREQEKELLGQIDRYMSENHCENVYSKHKENLGDLLAQGCSCTNNVQELLDRDEVNDLKDLQEVVVEQLNEFVEASETRLFWAEQDTKSGFGLKLLRSEALEKFIQEGSLGTIQRATGAAALRAPSFSQSGRVIRRITSSDIGQTGFSPFAVAVSKDSGNLAVLDESKKRVYVMNVEGEKQANNIQIQYGDLWDIAYSKDDEIVVVNRSNNRLLHYNHAGKFERKVVHAPADYNVKFTFLSVDSDGRYLVTSAPRYEESAIDTDSFVCVYSPDRESEMSFGHDFESALLSPKKAIWYSGEFFVPDSDRKSVVVFDEYGTSHREIGCGVLAEPAGIAIDSENDNILVCDYGNGSVQIFKTNGTFITKFDTEGRPVQIALSKDGEKIVLCSEGSSERFLQILSYIP